MQKSVNVTKKQGFSLIELSIIITIAATLALVMLQWNYDPLINDAKKIIETKQKMKVIEQAILEFRKKNNRLPCPAKEDQPLNSHYIIAPGQPNLSFDDENYNNATLACDISFPTGHIKGAVPTLALNLSSDYMLDAWGRRFTYAPESTICSAAGCSAATYSNNDGALIIKDTSTGSNINDEAIYVLLSHGSSGFGAYLSSGVRMALPSDIDSLENNNADNIYISKPIDENFKNIIIYKTKNSLDNMQISSVTNLISALECQQNSDELRKITQSIANSAPNNIRSILSLTQKCNSNITPCPIDNIYNYGDEASIKMMMTLQEICYAYYGNSIIRRCPGGVTANGGTFNNIDNTCECSTGLWNNNC